MPPTVVGFCGSHPLRGPLDSDEELLQAVTAARMTFRKTETRDQLAHHPKWAELQVSCERWESEAGCKRH
jgi:hypothetical protein